MLNRIAVIASLALTFAQPVAAQQEGAAKAVRDIQRCIPRLDRYFLPDPEHSQQGRVPRGIFDISFQADPAGVIALNSIALTSRDPANLQHDRALSRALNRCLDRTQNGAEPDPTAGELQSYVLPVTLLDAADRPKTASARDYFRTDTEFVIVTLLMVTMPAIVALPFAVTNR